MRRFITIASVLGIMGCIQLACIDDGANETPSQPSTPVKDGDAIQDDCNLSSLQTGVIGTEACTAIANALQCDDDYDYKSQCSGTSICRIYVKWDSDGAVYQWNDTYAGASGCTDSNLSTLRVNLVYDSVNKVGDALDSPHVYDTSCFSAENPITGEIIHAISFDDDTDPCTTVRRTVSITITPDTSCP